MENPNESMLLSVAQMASVQLQVVENLSYLFVLTRTAAAATDNRAVVILFFITLQHLVK